MGKPRTISFDDGSFSEFRGEVVIVGVVMRGNDTVENVVAGKVTIDGNDSTTTIIKLVKETPQNMNAIFIDGIALGGLNVVDLAEISRETGLPTISITRKKPDFESLKRAVDKTQDPQKKWATVLSNGPLLEYGNLFFQFSGTTESGAKLLIKECSRDSLPEGLRLAHIIASGITRGGIFG